MRVRLPVTALITALTFLSSGCFHDEPDPRPTSTVSPDVQAAADRLTAAMRQQMQAVAQAQQANNYAQIQQALSQQRQAQQKAQQYEQTLPGNQALADYYAARTRSNQRMTQIIKDQMQRAAEDEQRYQARRDQQRYEEKRRERQRFEDLYRQQRYDAQRREEDASGY